VNFKKIISNRSNLVPCRVNEQKWILAVQFVRIYMSLRPQSTQPNVVTFFTIRALKNGWKGSLTARKPDKGVEKVNNPLLLF
jgi:hypothetical protein